jgi:hypothetical protein
MARVEASHQLQRCLSVMCGQLKDFSGCWLHAAVQQRFYAQTRKAAESSFRCDVLLTACDLVA